MAWETTLLPASFRGILFEVQATQDDIERAIVTHEYPYVDGANVEDLGRAPRRFVLTAVFYGDDYEVQLQQLTDALDMPGPGELIHPVFGSKQVQFVRTSIPHQAELPDQTRLQLEFLEHALSTPLFDRVLPTQQVDAMNQAADDALSAASDRFVADIGRVGSLPSLVRDQLSTDMLGVMDKMRGYCDQLVDARGWLASGVYYLNNPTAFVDDLTGGLVSRLEALMTPMDLRIGYAAAGVASGYTSTTGSSYAGAGAAAGNTSSSTPSGYSASPAAAVGTSAVPVFTRGGLETVWNAPKTSLQQPLLVPAERSATAAPIQPFLVVHVDVQIAIAVAACTARLYAKGLADPVMTPDDIETVAEDTRTVLNAAIAGVRTAFPDIVQSRPVTEALKALALATTTAAEKLIAARPALRDRVVDTPGNLQLLAHLWYGDFHRADELLRLNPWVKNPNMIPGGTVLRAYAA